MLMESPGRVSWLVSRLRTLAVIGGGATLAAVVRSLAGSLQPVRVRGESMRPSLEPGDVVYAVGRSSMWGRLYPPKVGAIALVDLPWEHDRLAVKRLAAAPFEHVDGVADGDGWAVLGDQGVLSTDSRHHGRVPDSAILGIVLPGRRRAG